MKEIRVQMFCQKCKKEVFPKDVDVRDFMMTGVCTRCKEGPETIGLVRFEDGSGNKQLFWITYDREGTFEVLEGHESYGKVKRMSQAIELIGLHSRLINDEDEFFESLGLDPEDWEGTKKALLLMVDEQK